MNNWYDFILKILPNGKAFRSILFSKIFWQVLADGYKMIVDYGISVINDQVWYVNDNFDPVPWEARYNIIPPGLATLEERRQVVKSYMLFPQSGNRLSKDYMQSVIDDAGFTDILLEYNPLGVDDGFLHANDFSDEKLSFLLGSLTYNSFIVSGTVTAIYYDDVINLIMSLKPLQVVLYDKIAIDQAFAYDETLALVLDDNFALAINIL